MVAEFPCGIDRGTSVEGTVGEQAVEDRAVVANAVDRGRVPRPSGQFGIHVVDVGRGRDGEKVDIVVLVELFEFIFGGGARYVGVHRCMHAVGEDERFGESETPWFHRMRLAEVMVLNFGVGMPGYCIASRLRDAIVLDFLLNL